MIHIIVFYQVIMIHWLARLSRLTFEVLVELELRAALLAHRVDALHEVGGGVALRLRVRLPPQRSLQTVVALKQREQYDSSSGLICYFAK